MKTNKRVVLSSDHAAIEMRMKVAKHVVSLGWEAIDIGPTTSESTHYPHHGAAAAGLLGGFHQIRAHRGRQALGRRRPEALIDSIRFDSIRPCIHGSIEDVNRYCY